jgi:hypothetical protein
VPASLLFLAPLLALLPVNSSTLPQPLPAVRYELATPDTSVRRPSRTDSVLYGSLGDGASYRRILMPGGATVHVVAIDGRRGYVVEAAKAREGYDDLETLSEIYVRAERAARQRGDTIIAAINAGPWHPERLSPVGPLVVNGETVELANDGAWSSVLLYASGGGAITRDRLSAQLFWRHRQLELRSVNRRMNDESPVIYNRFYGDFVPSPTVKSDAEIVASALAQLADDDSGIDFGEEEVDTASIVRTYHTARARSERERVARKIAVRRLPTARRDWYGEPRLNDTMWTQVTMVDTGTVPVPRDGYVLSLGTSDELFHSVRPGDTVRLLFQIARNGLSTVASVVPGYPQLLFDGAAAQEPEFAQGPAASVRADVASARTAIGTSASGDTVLLVAVDAPRNGAGGVTIDELAALMLQLGAHNAVALEGRSSTTMVVNYDAVTHAPGTTPERPISNALVVKKKRKF